MANYSYTELKSAYMEAGVEPGKVVFVTGNLGRLGRYESTVKHDILTAHVNALLEIIGSTGTIVAPTYSFSLANTDKSFDYDRTPGEAGPLGEYLRQLPGAVRQFHPFSSSTALGHEALDICGSCSRHVYGMRSPFERMISRDALFLSVGKELPLTASVIHHAELTMGVPYRYVKEFAVRCVRDDVESLENFYLHVLYRSCDINRDLNVKLTESYGRFRKIPLGNSFVHSASMKDFFDHLTAMMSNDIYAWLRTEPTIRPYTI